MFFAATAVATFLMSLVFNIVLKMEVLDVLNLAFLVFFFFFHGFDW